MSTLNDVLTFSRAQAQTDSNGLTDTKGIIFANEALLDFRRRLIEKGVDAAQIQEVSRDATAGEGRYLYPTSPAIWFLKTIELNYVNSNAGDYVLGTQVDISNIPGGNSYSWLRSYANRNAPLFDDRGDWYEIFPTPQSTDNLSATIRLFYFVQPTRYTSTSDTISYPESLNYEAVGWRIVASYKRSLGDSDGALIADTEYEKKVKSITGTLSRGSQQPIQAIPIQDAGWTY